MASRCLFLSHSSADTEAARELKRRRLESPAARDAGMTVWFDKDDLSADFLKSLLAAYRPAEIMEQLVSINMNSLQIEVVSDRHLIAFGSID